MKPGIQGLEPINTNNPYDDEIDLFELFGKKNLLSYFS